MTYSPLLLAMIADAASYPERRMNLILVLAREMQMYADAAQEE